MAREEWQQDIQEGLKRERWSLTGAFRIVKVTPLSNGFSSAVSGYICLENTLISKTPAQIGAALGVRGKFDSGIRVYRLLRLPLSFEVDYELTADFPDGQAYNPAMHSSDYPPGSPKVHQWQLKGEIPAAHLLDLLPAELYPRHFV